MDNRIASTNLGPKKLREREILNLVYESRHLEEIVPSERPDFILTAWGRQFGVEVVELYLSETDARLDRIPEYSKELLGGGRFRHRDDPSHLKISKVDILNQDNQVVVRQAEGLLQDSIRVIDCALRAGSMIRNKGEKAATFSSGLAHTNLVILDHSRVLSVMAPDAFYRAFFVPELRKALAESPFREVFFVTKLKDGHGYVPLKMLFLLAEAFFFNAVYTELDAGRRIAVRELEVFGAYLSTVVAGKVRYREEEGGVEVCYGDSGLFVTGNLSVFIRARHDGPFPYDGRQPRGELVAVLGAEFLAKLANHKASRTFISPIFFPTKEFRV